MQACITIRCSTEAVCKGIPAVSMAGCGDLDHPKNTLSPSQLIGDEGEMCAADSPSSSTAMSECAICLQSCIHPVRLPCRHVFCFLCVKGASWHSKRCALCRQEVPDDFLEHPTLLSPEELKAAAAGVSRGGSCDGDYAWYYEGRNGWWQYDERTSRELQDAFAKGWKSTEMLIAGFLYVADLENMVQYRHNEHGRRRKIKRDVVGIPKKGVAGLRLDTEPVPIPALPVVTMATTERVCSADGANTAGQSQSGMMVSVPPVRPPIILGGHLVSPQPATASSLEESLAQLLLSPPDEDNDEVEADDKGTDGGQAYEFALGSSESEDERHGREERGREESMPRQRQSERLLARLLREAQLDRGPPRGRPAISAPTLRSRSPDGQCTVTDV